MPAITLEDAYNEFDPCQPITRGQIETQFVERPQAPTLYQKIGSRYSIPAQIGNYGLALLRVGQKERARPYLLQAADVFEQMGLDDYAARHRKYAA
jgi:O-phosphoseryl-tRNA(Cys) synthetase